MKRWRNILLGLLFSVVFLWIALRGLDWTSVGEILQSARWQYLLMAMLVWSLGLGTRAIRWRVLMGNEVSLPTTFHILNVGFLLNNTLPFRVGELARAFLIGRSDATTTGLAALTTIVAERIIDMLAVVLMLVIVLPALTVEQATITGGAIMGAIAVVGFGVLLVFAHRPRWAQNILSTILGWLPFLERFKLTDLLDRILTGLQPLTTWRGLLGAIFWTAISWGISVVGSWILALAFPALPATPLMRAALTLSIVAASFSIIVPFTLASVGPFEAAAIFALMTAGIAQELAAAFAVVWHTGTVVVYAAWGAIGIMSLGLSLEQIQQGAAQLGSQTEED